MITSPPDEAEERRRTAIGRRVVYPTIPPQPETPRELRDELAQLIADRWPNVIVTAVNTRSEHYQRTHRITVKFDDAPTMLLSIETGAI